MQRFNSSNIYSPYMTVDWQFQDQVKFRDRIGAVIRTPFLSRVSILTRHVNIANLSVCLSVCPSLRYVPVLYENGSTYYHSFLPRDAMHKRRLCRLCVSV